MVTLWTITGVLVSLLMGTALADVADMLMLAASVVVVVTILIAI